MKATKSWMLIVGLMLFSLGLAAQDEHVALYTKSVRHFNLGQYDSAIVSAKAAEELSEQREDWYNYISSDLIIAKSQTELSQFDLAKAMYDKCQRVADLYYPPNAKIHSEVKYAVGIYFKKRGLVQLAIGLLQQAVEIRQANDGSETFLSEVYNALGDAYLALNAMNQAIVYFEKAKAIFERSTTREGQLNISIADFNIAVALVGLAKYEEGLRKVEAVERVFGGYFPPEAVYMGVLYDAKGGMHYYLENYDSTIYYSQKGADIISKAIGKENLYYANAQINLGYAHEKMGTPQGFGKAIDHFREVSSVLSLQVIDENHNLISKSYQGLGRVQSQLGWYQLGISSLNKAAKTNLRNVKDQPSNILDIQSTEVMHAKNFLQILKDLGHLYLRQYEANQDPAALKSALAYYEKGLAEIVGARASYQLESDKIELSRTVFELYEGAVKAAMTLAKLDDEQAYHRKAFEIVQKSKGNVLAEALQRINASQFSGVPDEVIRQEQQLKDSIALYQQMINNVAIDQTKELLIQTRIKFIRDYELLTAQIKERHPAYYELRHQDLAISVKDLIAVMDKDEALISYFYDDQSLYIFVVTTKGLEVVERPLPNRFEKSSILLYNSLIHKIEDAFKSIAHELYGQLFPFELDDRITKLTIITHGALGNIPFETLLTSQAEPGQSWGALSYLIKRFDISYAYSISLYLKMRGGQYKKAPKAFIGFAPVFSDRSEEGRILKSNLPQNLPNPVEPERENKRGFSKDGKYIDPILATEDELMTIYQHFDHQGLDARAFTHDQAKESFFKKGEIENYRLIHFATHGFVDEDQPERSGLLMTQAEDGEEDGVLMVSEIYNLHFNADLVTLSACQTGLGRIVKSEGIIGFTRAFLFSGAKNLVVSLWKVADQSTSELMKTMYTEIELSSDKPSFKSALRAAKLQMIQNGQYAHPYYWSPFILIGH